MITEQEKNMVTKEQYLEAICKAAHVDDIGDVSDGYHTFNQLYYQRMMLFATIVKQNRDKAWKSLRHEDGELCFGGGWFIVGIDTPEGGYTYHYEDKYFDLFDCETLDNGKHWDGHTEKDVTRLLSLKQEPIFFPPCQDCNTKMDEIRRAHDKLKASSEFIEDDKREKAIQTIKELKLDAKDYGLENKFMQEVVEAFDTAMLSLQQEINLDKIRAEIASIAINGQVDDHTLFIRTGEQVKQMVLDIIDKYKVESGE